MFSSRSLDGLRHVFSSTSSSLSLRLVAGIKRNPDRFKYTALNKSSQRALEHSQLNFELLRFAGFADHEGTLTFQSSDMLEIALYLISDLLSHTESPASSSIHSSPNPKAESETHSFLGHKTQRRLLLHSIRFTQSSVASHFRDGQTLAETIERLRAGMSTDELPPIRVVEEMDLLWSLDNRRLHCMKEALFFVSGVEKD